MGQTRPNVQLAPIESGPGATNFFGGGSTKCCMSSANLGLGLTTSRPGETPLNRLTRAASAYDASTSAAVGLMIKRLASYMFRRFERGGLSTRERVPSTAKISQFSQTFRGALMAASSQHVGCKVFVLSRAAPARRHGQAPASSVASSGKARALRQGKVGVAKDA